MIKLTNILSETEYYMSHVKKDKKKVKEADEKPKKTKKTSIAEKVKEIEEKGMAVALEAQMNEIDKEIQERADKLTSIEENTELAEFINSSRVDEMKKEIKELSKAKEKIKKRHEKMTNENKKQKPEVIDETEEDK